MMCLDNLNKTNLCFIENKNRATAATEANFLTVNFLRKSCKRGFLLRLQFAKTLHIDISKRD